MEHEQQEPILVRQIRCLNIPPDFNINSSSVVLSHRAKMALLEETIVDPFGIWHFTAGCMWRFTIIEVIQAHSAGFLYSTINSANGEFYTIRTEKYHSNVAPFELVPLQLPKHPNVIRVAETILDSDSCTGYEIYIDNKFTWYTARDFMIRFRNLENEHYLSCVKACIYAALAVVSHAHDNEVLLGRLSLDSFVFDQTERVIKYTNFMKCVSGVPSYTSPENLYRPYRPYSARNQMYSDVWSVGCIFAELVRRAPLFVGEDLLLQIYRYCLGTEKKGHWAKDPMTVTVTDHVDMREKIAAMNPTMTDNGINLLERMLSVNPLNRISVRDAMNHGFFNVPDGDDHLEETWL